MHRLTRLWRAPVVRIVVVFVLLAAATGIVKGYAALGRVTVERHGSVDFGLFYASARQYLTGGDLYGPLVRPGTARAAESPNLNPPHANLFFLPFGLLAPGPALGVWMALSLLALADILRIVRRETGCRLWSVGTLAVAVYLLAWAPTAALVLTAQLGVLVAWPVTRGWRAARHGDWPRAGWWFGFSAGLKVFLLLLLPWLALRREWSALARAGGSLAALLAVGLAVFGPGAYATWVRQFEAVTWQGHYMNASVWGLLARLFEGFRAYEPLVLAPALVRPLWVALALLVLGVTLWRLARWREHDVDRDVGLVSAAALLASPLGWVYYFWLLLAPIALVVWRQRVGWGPAAYAAASLIAVAGLWHASATIWFQPSAFATATVASPYFWALAGAWVWLLRRDPSGGDGE